MILTSTRLVSTSNLPRNRHIQGTEIHKPFYERLISIYTDQLIIDAVPVLTLDQHKQMITINDTCIGLSNKPATYKMLESFFSNQSINLTREQIISHIYQPTQLAMESERHWESLCGRVNKLIGRARIFLHSQTDTEEPHLKWLTFDSHSKTWRLCYIIH